MPGRSGRLAWRECRGQRAAEFPPGPKSQEELEKWFDWVYRGLLETGSPVDDELHPEQVIIMSQMFNTYRIS